MSANLYPKTMTASEDEWQPLAASRTVVDATIIVWTPGSVPFTPLQIRFSETGDPANVMAGSFPLCGVDLSQVSIKGSDAYRVTVIGYTV